MFRLGFYGIPIFVDYSIWNFIYIYIYIYACSSMCVNTHIHTHIYVLSIWDINSCVLLIPNPIYIYIYIYIGLIVCYINHCWLFTIKSIFIRINRSIPTIQFNISTIFVYIQLNVTTVLYQTIQFSINSQFSSTWPIDRTLSGTTTPDHSKHGAMAMKGTSHSTWLQHDCSLTIRLFSLIYKTLVGGVLSFCREKSRFILQLQSTGPKM